MDAEVAEERGQFRNEKTHLIAECMKTLIFLSSV